MENIRVMPANVGIKLNEVQEIRKNLKDPKIEDDVLVVESATPPPLQPSFSGDPSHPGGRKADVRRSRSFRPNFKPQLSHSRDTTAAHRQMWSISVGCVDISDVVKVLSNRIILSVIIWSSFGAYLLFGSVLDLLTSARELACPENLKGSSLNNPMGTGKQSRPPKTSKPVSSSQEIPTAPYPDWSSFMQAYHGHGAMPPPLFASPVASPTPHPYLWGSQHLLIPPYAMQVPYPGLYPPWGVYAHPNMTTTPNPIQINAELERKGPYGKDRASAKKSKASSGSLGKAIDSLKATSGFENDGASRSAESGTKGTSDASDENNDKKVWTFAGSKKGIFHQMLADGANAQSNNVGPIVEASILGKHVSMPETNLNIGMDLWNASVGGAGVAKVRQNPNGASLEHMIGSEDVMPEQWIQIPNDDASVLKVVPQIGYEFQPL
ncbi:hypothetical protein FH972_004158 [Carpinus fangiana]|uniref:G-box binding protein multifunctional mosaic region domain-containing protein n=1 Tax=Carpinus fangiana TaxID=176857 RepID=A0A5N6QKW6_9ROSI|nr:hypothetical protein FH972_004158 [Carpinus fangiana]